jgi:hypothetical protein
MGRTAPSWVYGVVTLVAVVVLVLGLVFLVPGGSEDEVVEPAPTSTSSEPETTFDTLPDLGLPGMNLDEPAGEYGWSNRISPRGWMHKVIEDPAGVTRQTQLAFVVGDYCFANAPEATPVAVTVAGLEGFYVEPIDDEGYWSRSHPGGGETTAAYSLPIGDRTLCVYLRWEAATTPEELNAARDVVESIRGVPIGDGGIWINFTLPAGWDTG